MFSCPENFGEKTIFGEKIVNQNPTKTGAKRGVVKKETLQTMYLRGFVPY